MIEQLAYLQALLAEWRMRLIWRLLPRTVTTIQLYSIAPAVMTGDELRLSTAPQTFYRAGSLA